MFCIFVLLVYFMSFTTTDYTEENKSPQTELFVNYISKNYQKNKNYDKRYMNISRKKLTTIHISSTPGFETVTLCPHKIDPR
jgi:hypothetical protein